MEQRVALFGEVDIWMTMNTSELWSIWDYYDASKPLCYCTEKMVNAVAELIEVRIPDICIQKPGEMDWSKFSKTTRLKYEPVGE
jgi:hypothetical protein